MKKLIALLLALVMVVSMTACAGSGTTEPTSAPASNENAAPAATEAKEEVKEALPVMGNVIKYDPNVAVNNGEDIEIELWYWTGAANLFEKLANQYMEIHPNVTIKLVENPWDDYWTKLPLLLQGSVLA